MKILPLGHSSFILEMAPDEGADPVRILVDPWLSDYCIGDLMGRFPRVRINYSAMPEVHAVYLTHAHTDHLDAESLLALWAGLPSPPALLLPQSLAFLEDLLREHLPGGEVILLEEDRPLELRGLTLTGFFNPAPEPTNEDDVMVLLVTSEKEAFLCEADALLPWGDPEARGWITDLLCDERYESICLLSSRNELSATMSALAATSLEDRAERVSASLERTCEEIEGFYAPLDELETDLWRDERVVRLVGGQGLCHPQALGGGRNRTLFPIRIRDRVSLERDLAQAFGCAHRIEALVPGVVNDLTGKQEPVPFLAVLDKEKDRAYDPDLEVEGDFPIAPLRDEARDATDQSVRIGRALNERFLPWLVGARRPPFEELLAACGGEYRIRVRFGRAEDFVERDFVSTFREVRFAEGDPTGDPQEAYWANDIEDFLDGTADEFSTFCRKPLDAPAQRFWLCLGLPFLNQDLVLRKHRLHFARAAAGGTNREWVLPFHGGVAAPRKS